MARQKGVAIETFKTSGTVHTEIKNKINELEVDLLILGELSTIRSRRDEFYNESERAMRSAPGPHIEALAEIARLTRSKAFCNMVTAAVSAREVVDIFRME